MHRVAEAGPVAIYSVDENFFPLSVWLKNRMRRNLDEFNRVADRLVSTEGELEARSPSPRRSRSRSSRRASRGRPAPFWRDGIIQTLGLDAYRAALAGGPRAFFEAYDKASDKKGSGLMPLARRSAIGWRRRRPS